MVIHLSVLLLNQVTRGRFGDENGGMDTEERKKKGRNAGICLLHWLEYHLEL